MLFTITFITVLTQTVFGQITPAEVFDTPTTLIAEPAPSFGTLSPTSNSTATPSSTTELPPCSPSEPCYFNLQINPIQFPDFIPNVLRNATSAIVADIIQSETRPVEFVYVTAPPTTLVTLKNGMPPVETVATVTCCEDSSVYSLGFSYEDKTCTPTSTYNFIPTMFVEKSLFNLTSLSDAIPSHTCTPVAVAGSSEAMTKTVVMQLEEPEVTGGGNVDGGGTTGDRGTPSKPTMVPEPVVDPGHTDNGSNGSNGSNGRSSGDSTPNNRSNGSNGGTNRSNGGSTRANGFDENKGSSPDGVSNGNTSNDRSSSDGDSTNGVDSSGTSINSGSTNSEDLDSSSNGSSRVSNDDSSSSSNSDGSSSDNGSVDGSDNTIGNSSNDDNSNDPLNPNSDDGSSSSTSNDGGSNGSSTTGNNRGDRSSDENPPVPDNEDFESSASNIGINAAALIISLFSVTFL